MKNNKIIISGLIIVVITVLATAFFILKNNNINYDVTVYETNGNKAKLLEKQDDIKFSKDNIKKTTVKFEHKAVKQDVYGVGAALTHAAAYNINKSKFREAMINEFFSTENGSSFDVVRLTIGASDYSLSHFTLNDTVDNKPDLSLSNFSLNEDHKDLIPVLQDVIKRNPNIKIVAAPWSAPAWMKSSKSLYSGSLNFEYEASYVNYLVKYILEYQKLGITINYISIQNEPLHGQSSYPVMYVSYTQAIRLSTMLYEQFEEKNISTKIIGYDHNTDNVNYPLNLLKDKDANKAITGIAFHGYTGNGNDLANAFNKIKEEYPNKELYFTEITAHDGSKHFGNNLTYALENVLFPTFNNFGSMALYWNLVLDENNEPNAGGGGDSNGIFRRKTDDSSYEKLAEFYALSHISKFINTQDGLAKNVETSSNNMQIKSLGFKKADGKYVLIVLNTSNNQTINTVIEYNKHQIEYRIKPQSVITFLW